MTRRAKSTRELEERIGYTFADQQLLKRALSHSSSAGARRTRNASYERLEFLGDHVLGLVIAEMLFREFPNAAEGDLSRRLSALVRKDACVEVARAMDLGPVIRLGASEASSGGRMKPAILADVCESLVGAVYIDGGLSAASGLIERFWRTRMKEPKRPPRDAKTVLQEWAQGRGLPTPLYKEISRSGPHHSPEFHIEVTLPEHDPAIGMGHSKRAAEQAAAALMLVREGVDGTDMNNG